MYMYNMKTIRRLEEGLQGVKGEGGMKIDKPLFSGVWVNVLIRGSSLWWLDIHICAHSFPTFGPHSLLLHRRMVRLVLRDRGHSHSRETSSFGCCVKMRKWNSHISNKKQCICWQLSRSVKYTYVTLSKRQYEQEGKGGQKCFVITYQAPHTLHCLHPPHPWWLWQGTNLACHRLSLPSSLPCQWTPLQKHPMCQGKETGRMMNAYTHVYVHVYYSYMTLIGMHSSMQLMHPN